MGDTVSPSQTILDLYQELIKGYANNAGFAKDAKLQDLQIYEEVWCKADRTVVQCTACTLSFAVGLHD